MLIESNKIHEQYMSRCIQLALLGKGTTAPNPMVGAVLVHQGRIIGEGYHRQYGGPHAEVNCINSVLPEHRHLISSSTIYVSLEPCAHYGKTPPCANLILTHQIPKVVIGCQDPFAQVDGKGIQLLINAGVEVITGVLENECMELNVAFNTFHKHHRPYIVLKWAQDRNGYIGTGSLDRVLISNEYSNLWVHKLRTELVGILVGANTIIQDNPLLDARKYNNDLSPIKIIFDENGSLDTHYQVFNQGNKTLLFTRNTDILNKFNGFNNVEIILIHNEDFIQEAMNHLYILNIQSILVEGGGQILHSFIDKNMWDNCYVIESNIVNDTLTISAPRLKNAQPVAQWKLMDNTITTFVKR